MRGWGWCHGALLGGGRACQNAAGCVDGGGYADEEQERKPLGPTSLLKPVIPRSRGTVSDHDGKVEGGPYIKYRQSSMISAGSPDRRPEIRPNPRAASLKCNALQQHAPLSTGQHPPSMLPCKHCTAHDDGHGSRR